jgi:hypothetical protein
MTFDRNAARHLAELHRLLDELALMCMTLPQDEAQLIHDAFLAGMEVILRDYGGTPNEGWTFPTREAAVNVIRAHYRSVSPEQRRNLDIGLRLLNIDYRSWRE